MSDFRKKPIDWKATLASGIVSGLVFYLSNIFLTPIFVGGNEWLMVRLMASPVLGETVLAPQTVFSGSALLVSMLTTLALGLVFAAIIAVVIHRGGLMTGIWGGAALGLALYAINFYTLTLWFPWFFAFNSGLMVLLHLFFGAVAGGVYEALEEEQFQSPS